MPSKYTPIQAGTSMEQIISILNRNFGELDNETLTKIYNSLAGTPALIEGILPNDLGSGTMLKDTTGTPRIVMYIDSSNNPVFKISPAGVDVTTATNAQLSFNSSQNVFKIVSSGTLTIDPVTTAAPGAGNFVNFSQSSAAVSHSLGYTPAVLAFEFDQANASYIPLPSNISGGTGTTCVWTQTSVYVTSTTILATVKGTVTGPTGGLGSVFTKTIKYYLLQESAN